MSGKLETRWIRILDDVIGLIVIVTSIVAVLELTFSFVYALEILSIGLIAIGIAWIVMGLYVVCAYRLPRIFMLVTGFAAIAIAIVDFIFVSLPPDSLVIYPSIAMLLVGSSRIVLGLFVTEIPLWIRMLQGLAGILTVNLAAFVFIFPGITFESVMILLVISFLTNGLVRLIVSRTEIKTQLIRSAREVAVSEEST